MSTQAAPIFENDNLSRMGARELAALMRMFSALNDAALDVCNQPRHKDDPRLDDIWQWTGHYVDRIEEELINRRWSSPEDIELAAWSVLECKAKYGDDLARFSLLSLTFAEQSNEAEMRD